MKKKIVIGYYDRSAELKELFFFSKNRCLFEFLIRNGSGKSKRIVLSYCNNSAESEGGVFFFLFKSICFDWNKINVQLYFYQGSFAISGQ